MRLTYIIILVLVIAGFFAADYLTPSRNDIAMMKLDGAKLIESPADYETQVTIGNLSPEVVFPLVRIYLENNELNRAIALLEAYLVKSPNDIRALDRLSTLYQYAGRQADYAKVLERMNTLRADPENLKKLSDIYNYNQDYAKEAAVLEQLLQKEPDKTENYTKLAFIYRQMNRNEDAATVMKTLFERNPKAMNQEGMESWVIALSQLGRQDDAFAIASNWFAGQSEKVRRQSVLRLSNIFYAGRRPDLSLFLLQPYRNETNDPDITIALVRAEIADGQETAAYNRMLALYKASRLPESLQELFLDVAIRQRNIPLVQALTGPGDADRLPEFRFIQLVEFYQDEKQIEPIRTLRISVGAQRLNEMPVLDTIFALALQEPSAQAKAEAQLKIEKHPVYESVALSRATMRAGMTELSKQFLFSMRPYDKIEDNDLGALTWLMLQHKVTDEGLRTFEGFRTTRPSLLVDIAWVKMATAAGQEKPVIQWLNAHVDDVITPALLRDIYYIANDYKHPAIAVSAAKRLYWRTATDDDEYIYATALINNGQQVEAFEYIAELKANGYAMDPQLYNSVLANIAPDNPKYWPEMIALLKTQIAQPNLTEEQQIAIIQQLVTHNAADDYLPMIKERALAKRDSQWFYFYEALLRKQHKFAEIRALEREQAERPGAPRAEKRRVAYDSLAVGDKKDAAALFIELSNTAKPGDKDLEQLLYLWGARPEEDKLDWMARRAVSAPAQERVGWLKILFASGGFKQIISLVENIPVEKRDRMEDAIYLESLQVLGNATTEAELGRMVDNTADPKRLRTLRSVALANNYPVLADKILEKLLLVDPNDLSLQRDYGFNLYNKANYSKAMDVFKQYHAKGGDDFRTFYEAADILNRSGKKDEAIPYYQRALVGAKTLTKPDTQSELITAKSLFHLGRYAEAQDIMARVVKENPDDKNLQADYVLLLLSDKQYDQARDFFASLENQNQAPQNITFTPMAAEVSSIVLPRAHVLKVRGTQLPNEIAIQFAGEASKQPLITTLQHEMPSWLQLASTSYDSIVLVADHGIRLSSNFEDHTDATANFMISGTMPEQKKVITKSMEQENKDGEIRLELLHAQLDLETGHQDSARARLEALNQQYPNRPPVLSALSSVEWYMGHTPEALGHVTQVLALSPGNEDAKTLYDHIEESQRGFVKADGSIQLIGNDVQVIGQLSGEQRIDQQNTVGIIADNNYVMVDNERKGQSGEIRDTSGMRERQDVYVRHQLDNGDQVKASGFFNMDTLGAGIQYVKRYFMGDITLDGEYHRSNWDFAEGALDEANRDRIAYTQSFRFRPDIAPTITVGYNRYNIEDFDDVDRSWTVNGTARMPLYYFDSGMDPRLFAEYGLDAEYRTDAERALDSIGNSYLRYPLVTREVHYGTVGWREILDTDYIDPSYWEAFGGYAYDRISGNNGPYLGASWIQQLGFNKEFELRFTHSIGFKSTGDDYTLFGGYFKWKL